MQQLKAGLIRIYVRMYLEFSIQGKARKKNYVYSWSVSKLMKNNFSQTPNNSTNPTEETHEENYTMPHHNQIDKNQW